MKFSELAIVTLGGAVAVGCLVTATASAIMQRNAIEARSSTQTLEGTIEKIMLDRNEFILQVKSDGLLMGSREITIKVHDKTRYTLDGEDSTRDAALKPDREAKVSHEENLASRVDVRTAKKPG